MANPLGVLFDRGFLPAISSFVDEDGLTVCWTLNLKEDIVCKECGQNIHTAYHGETDSYSLAEDKLVEAADYHARTRLL